MSDHTPDQSGWEPPHDTQTWQIPEPPTRGRLFSTIIAAMQERNWHYDECGEGMIRASVRAKTATYDVFLSALEDAQMLRCWVFLPVRVEEVWRGALCDLFNRINFSHLLVGNFEVDPSEGTPRWRAAIDVEGAEPVPQLVHNLISAGLSLTDTFWPAIIAVSVLGTSPEAAIRLVTEG